MRYTLILMLSLLSLITMAEVPSVQPDGKRPRMEELRQNKWTFIVTKAKLTDAEVAKVKPLYDVYEQKLWSLLENNRETFRAMRKKNQNDKPDFEKLNETWINFELLKAQYQKDYYLKLKKVVSAETIHKLLKAENSFARDLMKNGPKGPNNRD